MKTLHLTLVAALVAGCHFDKLFNSAPGGSHAPPPGSGSIRLAFTAQPTDAMKDSIIKPPVQVTVFDSVGSVVTSFAGDVTLAIGNDPGVLKARLSGRSQAAASAGVATFGDLSINQLGNGYTLMATIDAGTLALAKPFIRAAAMSALRVDGPRRTLYLLTDSDLLVLDTRGRILRRLPNPGDATSLDPSVTVPGSGAYQCAC